MSPQPLQGSTTRVAAAPEFELQAAGADPVRQRAVVSAAVTRAALKGKEIGLLCDDPSQPEALLAYRAAAELGARVSLVRPRFEELGETEAMHEAVRMLGRLYDGVACVAISGAAIAELRALAGVPVVVSPAGHALSTCATSPVATDDDRYLPWQAALLAGFAQA